MPRTRGRISEPLAPWHYASEVLRLATLGF